MEPSTALTVARFIENLGVSFIPSTVLIFALEIVGFGSEFRPAVAAGLSGSAIFYLLGIATPWFIPGTYTYPWGYYPEYGPLSYGYLLFFLTLVGFALHLIVQQYRRALTELQRRRMMLLIAASLISYVGLVDLLGAYGVAVYPFGYVGVLGYLFVIDRVVTRYRLVDITPSEMAGQIMDTMTDGLVVIDRNGIARLANAAAKKMFRGDPINRRIGEVPVLAASVA